MRTKDKIKAKSARRVVRHFVMIDEALYAVTPLTNAGAAFRLTKNGGAVYDIADGARGATCDCPDYIYRRDGLDPKGCKHIQALVEIGLLSPR